MRAEDARISHASRVTGPGRAWPVQIASLAGPTRLALKKLADSDDKGP